MAMRGSLKNEQGNGTEMFPSAMAQLAYTPGFHLQEEPVPLCDSFLSFRSQPLQMVRPTDLKSLFSPEDPALANLRRTRDQVLDTLYTDMLRGGSRAQREFVDRYANSRAQAQSLGDQLGELLAMLPTDPEEPNSARDQVIAAVALAQLKISPVITINISFGGDNHQDTGLIREEADTLSGVAAISELWSRLKAIGIQDEVTFATMNVFGRRSYLNGRGGRDHNQHHTVMVAFGANIKGGVYGSMNGEGRATAIGDVGIGETMEAAGVSLARGLGHSSEVVNERLPGGRAIGAFLRGA